MWSIWMVSFLALLLLEGLMPGVFFFLCFAIGCLAAIPVSLLGFALEIQVLTMLMISFIALMGLKAWLDRLQYSAVKSRSAVTNVDALVGQKVVINAPILAEQFGSVTLAGDVWSCKNIGPNLAPTDQAIVIKVEGNKLFISKN